jgi:nitrate/TMAO reductase-like tetraheme cytochrome c subunit
MVPRPRFTVLLAVLFLAGISAVASGLLNPHIKPEPCGSCHTKVPSKEDGQAGNYFLLKDTIDATCHACHEYDCCKPGSLHGFNHPSDISRWDWKKFRRPKTLPLHNGKITCNTCHFHTVPDAPSYKMVRIIGGKQDSSDLCTDCHLDY